MSDYIKREDAIFVALQQPLYSVVSQIKQLEGVDIVRCKECKHFKKNDSILRGKWWCDLWADTIEDDGYCSYGEREDE